MILWDKHGLCATQTMDGFTHASHPTAIEISENKLLLGYCGRDSNQHSHIFFQTAEIQNKRLKLHDNITLALSPGEPGTFDCHGLLTCNFVRDDSEIHLYYCGWQNLLEGMWHCDTGRALVDAKRLEAKKQFNGPILGRRQDIPLYAVATTVVKEGPEDWIAWYNRGLSWSKSGENWIPKYGIHYATSKDGLAWECETELIIPFKDEYEHSFGRPTVIKVADHYLMWFAARGANQNPLYRIGLAISKNGRSWLRIDDSSGLLPEGSDWESDSVCYPYVFLNNGTVFMLYNGNNYGLTGFGYATTEISSLLSIVDTFSPRLEG